LVAIATNCVRDVLRARRVRSEALRESSDENLLARGETGLQVYARQVLREEVSRALDQLPADFREVIALKYMSDLSYEEVARCLGLSVSAAKMRALRGRQMLAELLAHHVDRPTDPVKP